MEALRESEERYRALVDATPIGVFVLEDGCCAYDNPAGQKILGCDPASMGKAPMTDFVPPEFHETISCRLARLEGGHPNPPMEIGMPRADGQQIPVEGVSVPITWKGRPAVLVVCQDISERKKAEANRVRLEQQLCQAQKMEAIGLLAGGAAHDFNNLLTVVLGRTEMARMLLPGDSPLSQDLDLVAQAAQKGASLTRHLLAFARKQPMQRQTLPLNRLIQDMLKILSRLMGEDARLEAEIAEGLWPVRGDPGALEQTLMNLAVNARDDMPAGGTLFIHTGNTVLKEGVAERIPEACPGRYVCLSVRDTGCGIAPEHMSRIFEPFLRQRALEREQGWDFRRLPAASTSTADGWRRKARSAKGRPFTSICLPKADPRRRDGRKEGPRPDGKGAGIAFFWSRTAPPSRK
ncbi:MAG: PAS domain S-box protein [Armatimonadetes bacterium]|nr:PAS domain S-box protein [Armatimonadota bacterium]